MVLYFKVPSPVECDKYIVCDGRKCANRPWKLIGIRFGRAVQRHDPLYRQLAQGFRSSCPLYVFLGDGTLYYNPRLVPIGSPTTKLQKVRPFLFTRYVSPLSPSRFLSSQQKQGRTHSFVRFSLHVAVTLYCLPGSSDVERSFRLLPFACDCWDRTLSIDSSSVLWSSSPTSF